MKIKAPTLVTLLRLILIPVLLIVYYLPFEWSGFLAGCVFALAGISDWLDGYLARRLGLISNFGAFLDPAVDKLIVAVALVVLVGNPNLHYIVLPAAVIIGREIAVSALREWMAELGKRATVAVSFVGKVKTTFQIIAIIGLLACNPLNPGFFYYGGYLSLYIAAILTLWSMFMYMKTAWPDFKLHS